MHVFNTWALANLLHPVFIFMGFYFFEESPEDFFSFITVPVLGLVYLATYIFSLPCLFASWFFNFVIIRLELTIAARYALWFATSIILTASMVYIVALYLQITLKETLYFFPSISATSLALIIRYRNFTVMVDTFEKTRAQLTDQPIN